jgi:hypothetical protein
MIIMYILAIIGVLFIVVCLYACCVLGGRCDDETEAFWEREDRLSGYGCSPPDVERDGK